VPREAVRHSGVPKDEVAMNEWESSEAVRERRSAHRFEARHVARLQFVTPLSDLRGADGAGLWPTLVCQTRDLSESGAALLVPAVREGDENFFGLEGPVRVTLSLPHGAVSANAVAVRYERGGARAGGFLVCVEVAETDVEAARRWASYIRSCTP
jgi:hypothetical protein